MYKLIILSASAGGKSTLMRYLRKHTDFKIIEMDEELVAINGGKWPFDDNYKNTVLVPEVTKKVLELDNVIYLSSYLPDNQAKEARRKDFMIVLMDVSLQELEERNKKRMAEEKYESVAEYFGIQLSGFERLFKDGLIDKKIDGHKSTEDIANEISELVRARE